MVSVFGRLPASELPRRIWNTGKANVPRIARPMSAMAHGRRCTTRLHRNQMLRSEVFVDLAHGRPHLSMLCPVKPRIAGSSVTEAIMVISTANAAPVARP